MSSDNSVSSDSFDLIEQSDYDSVAAQSEIEKQDSDAELVGKNDCDDGGGGGGDNDDNANNNTVVVEFEKDFSELCAVPPVSEIPSILEGGFDEDTYSSWTRAGLLSTTNSCSVAADDGASVGSSITGFDILSLNGSSTLLKCRNCSFLNLRTSKVCAMCPAALIANPFEDQDEQIAMNLQRKEERSNHSEEYIRMLQCKEDERIATEINDETPRIYGIIEEQNVGGGLGCGVNLTSAFFQTPPQGPFQTPQGPEVGEVKTQINADKPKQQLLTAYSLFSQQERKRMLEADCQMNFIEMSQAINSKWKQLDEPTRQTFRDKAKARKQEEEEEKEVVPEVNNNNKLCPDNNIQAFASNIHSRIRYPRCGGTGWGVLPLPQKALCAHGMTFRNCIRATSATAAAAVSSTTQNDSHPKRRIKIVFYFSPKFSGSYDDICRYGLPAGIRVSDNAEALLEIQAASAGLHTISENEEAGKKKIGDVTVSNLYKHYDLGKQYLGWIVAIAAEGNGIHDPKCSAEVKKDGTAATIYTSGVAGQFLPLVSFDASLRHSGMIQSLRQAVSTVCRAHFFETINRSEDEVCDNNSKDVQSDAKAKDEASENSTDNSTDVQSDDKAKAQLPNTTSEDTEGESSRDDGLSEAELQKLKERFLMTQLPETSKEIQVRLQLFHKEAIVSEELAEEAQFKLNIIQSIMHGEADEASNQFNNPPVKLSDRSKLEIAYIAYKQMDEDVVSCFFNGLPTKAQCEWDTFDWCEWELFERLTASVETLNIDAKKAWSKIDEELKKLESASSSPSKATACSIRNDDGLAGRIQNEFNPFAAVNLDKDLNSHALSQEDTSGAQFMGDASQVEDKKPSALITFHSNEIRTLQVKKIPITDARGGKGSYSGSLSMSSELPHGTGRLEYQEAGRWYVGDWKCGHWEGHGRLSNGDGDFYKGAFLQSKRHGRGTMTFSDGCMFVGEYVNNEMFLGKMTYQDGSTYEGSWLDEMKDGYGKCVFVDSSIYEGYFRRDEFHGYGKMIWSDGGLQEGEWYNGEMHGRGKEIRPDGTVRHDGVWRNGKPKRSTVDCV